MEQSSHHNPYREIFQKICLEESPSKNQEIPPVAPQIREIFLDPRIVNDLLSLPEKDQKN